MTNQVRTFSGLNPGDTEVRLCAQVADQLFHELNPEKTPDPDQQDISDLLGALSFLEGFTVRRLNKLVPLDHDDGEHGVNNHRRLAALRARVNRRLESLASERG
jgi:hypothetical protein